MNNAQKIPFQSSLNRFAAIKAASAIQQLGKSLPASVVSVKGSIVTVKFELTNIPFTLPNVTIPLFGPSYIRYPIQKGDAGVVIAVDARIGGVSGLGTGTADLSQPANLSSLFFMPVGNANWDTATPGALVLKNAAAATSGNFAVGTGATGTFTTPTGQTVTVQDGIIVNIF